jgi:hypothetical protein
MPSLIPNATPNTPKLVAAFKAIFVAIGAGSSAHLDRDDYGDGVQNAAPAASITAANGDGTLAKLLVLSKQIVGAARKHAASTEAHKAADTALDAAITVNSCDTLAHCITNLNAVKAWYNTHRASTTYHYNADATNSVTAADAATTQAQADTLANDIKAKWNLHLASGASIGVPRLTF